MILLSSVSFAYGAVDSKFVYIKNENMFDNNIYQPSYEYIKPNYFVINLQDGIDVKLASDGHKKNDIPFQHVVNLNDATSVHLGWGRPYENLNERAKIISVNINDGIKASSPTNDDEKIFIIKNNTHRQTTWEGIFPSDRPKNNTKSVYKTIQDDELLNKNSEQYNQESNDEQIILQNAGSNVFVVNLFDGVAAKLGNGGMPNEKTSSEFIGPYKITSDSNQHSIHLNLESFIVVYDVSEESQ